MYVVPSFLVTLMCLRSRRYFLTRARVTFFMSETLWIVNCFLTSSTTSAGTSDFSRPCTSILACLDTKVGY